MAIELNTKPYCNCHSTGKWLRQDGYTLDLDSGLWVHPRCMKPSKMNYDRFVLGYSQIPQQRKPEDIYEIEYRSDLRKVTNKEIAAELGEWEDDDDDEDY